MKKYLPVLIVVAFVIGVVYAILQSLGISISLEWLKENVLNYWIEMFATIVFGFLYMMFNEIEDAAVRNRFKKSWWKFSLEFLNAKLSSNNKWKVINGKLQPYKKKWYHFGIATKYEEAFIYSSTIFVFMTDMEHLAQWMKNRSINFVLLFWYWPLALTWIIGTSTATFLKEKYFKDLD